MAVLLVMAVSSSFAQASFETIGGLRYLIDSDAKTATVVASNGEKYSGDIVVPEKVKAQDGVEYPVTAIGDRAFYECSRLISITIPSTVTTLGNHCFSQCYGLSKFNIPSSVVSLGDYCFQRCNGLTELVVPSSVTTLGEFCFFDCYNLTKINIPSSVSTLRTGCFYGCSSLTNVTIPSSIKSLEVNCFYRCSGLTNIIIPSSVTSLGNYCFAGCSSLKDITMSSSVTSLGLDCFSGCESLTSFIVPSSVVSIGSNSFANCLKIEMLTFKGKYPENTANFDLPTTCLIYVPQAYLQDYKDALGNKYPYIYASKEDESGDDKQTESCATPTITYSDGELQFASTTEGAQYHYTIVDADMANEAFSEDGKVQLVAAYENRIRYSRRFPGFQQGHGNSLLVEVQC